MFQAIRPTCLLFALGLALLAGPAFSQTTVRASVATGGAQATGPSGVYGLAVSDGDGRYVAFYSEATDLVPNDTNGQRDIFIRDLQAGTTALVSVASSGQQANGLSLTPSISADGRYVVFESNATNLDLNQDTNGQTDVFLRDTWLAFTQRVSLTHGSQGQANLGGSAPMISGDGQCIAFTSSSTNLVANDTNNLQDIFVRFGQSTERVSVSSSGVQANGHSWGPAISSTGRFVVFWSDATNLVNGDTNGFADVFLRDRQSDVTERVSISSSGTQGDSHSDYGAGRSVSADGRFVVFASLATFLVPGDSNGTLDVFVRDRQLGTTELVSVASDGVQGNWYSDLPSISYDGRYVAFRSGSNNLVPNDTSGEDIFVRDLVGGSTVRASLSTAGSQPNGICVQPWISGNGRFVAFWSEATNLVAGDTNGVRDVFVRDRGDAVLDVSYCFGDGSIASCPCTNSGLRGHGCQNSVSTGGSVLTAAGNASLSADTLDFTATGERATALSILLQGTSSAGYNLYGDGLRCAGGTLKRLFTKTAAGGVVAAPEAGDPTVSAASAAKGDTITAGTVRVYQIYYRDGAAAFCPLPQGSTFNISQALIITWQG